MKHLLAYFCLVLAAFAQSAPKPSKALPPPPPPDAYLFPADIKVQLRDLQYKGDQLEIQNRQLEVEIKQIEQQNAEITKREAQIAQNKNQQSELLNQMKLIAFDFASKKQIDLGKYELDPSEMKMAKKKNAHPPSGLTVK